MASPNIVGLLAVGLVFACTKKEESDNSNKLTIQPQVLRLPLSENAGLKKSGARLIDPSDDTSLMQSFTPTSIRLSIKDISIASGDVNDWNSPGYSIYSCDGETNADCMVEVSNLGQFEDALNASPVELAPDTYTKVRVGMCAVPGGKQTVEITGSASLNGVTYITDTTAGIVAGAAADAKPVTFEFAGCAVQIPLAQPITAELTEEQKAEAEGECTDCAPTVTATIGLRLLFDSYNFAAMGNMLNNATKELVANAADNLEQKTFNQADSDCKGDKAGLFICTQRTALYATDDRAPQVKRFAIALNDTEANGSRPFVANPDPTVYTGLMLRSDGVVLAAYTRRSVDEGAAFNLQLKGDENFWHISTNADGSLSMKEGATDDPGVKPTYSAFKVENHSGERLKLNGIDLVPYTATLLP